MRSRTVVLVALLAGCFQAQSQASQRVSAEFTDADIKAVLRAISATTGVQVVVDLDLNLSGNVSLSLESVEWWEVVTTALEPFGATWEQVGQDLIVVRPLSKGEVRQPTWRWHQPPPCCHMTWRWVEARGDLTRLEAMWLRECAYRRFFDRLRGPFH
jgi:hypothetical protein